MDKQRIENRIAELRADQTRIDAELARLMLEHRRLEQLKSAGVVPFRTYGVRSFTSNSLGGWNGHTGTVQTAIRAALDRIYASRGISRIGGIAA